MANGSQRRTRSERVAALELPPGKLERAWLVLCQRDVPSRIALASSRRRPCAQSSRPSIPHPLADGHGVHALRDGAGPFEQENRNETEKAELKAREETKAIFTQDIKPLEQLRADLRNTIAELTKTETLTEDGSMWKEFQPPLKNGASRAHAQGGTRRLPGIPQAPGRKENLDQLDRAVAEVSPPGAPRIARRPHGEAKRFQ